MKKRTPLVAALLLFVLSISGPATAALYRVGPSRALTEISAALTLATAGDTILVDAGSYGPFVVSRGVSILVDGFAFSVTPAPGRPAITLANVPAGEQCLVSGLVVTDFPGDGPAVYVSRCAGAVFLRGLEVRTQSMPAGFPAALLIDGCDSVWLDGVTIRPTVPGSIAGLALGPAALACHRSWVQIQNADLEGFVPSTGQKGYGIAAHEATLFVSESNIRGGYPILSADASRIGICGVVLTPSGGNLWLTLGGSTVYACLSGGILVHTPQAVALGGIATIHLESPFDPRSYVLFLDLVAAWSRSGRSLADGLPLFLDPSTALVASVGSLPAGARVPVISALVPMDAALLGLVVFAQAAGSSTFNPAQWIWSQLGVLYVR